MENITSYSEISTKLINNSKSILLLFKSGHRESECAYQNLEVVLQNMNSVSAFAADVNTVIDIHRNYGITRVPSFIIFDNGKFKNAVNGCQNKRSIKSIMNKTFSTKKTNSKVKSDKNVTVYSTPTCGWCMSLKTWLQSYGIKFTDIDVSRDEKAARSLIKRSGHQGVPQIEINDEMVIGFQLPRLKELLEIK